MKPINFTDLLNSDDVGHFMSEGVKQVLSHNKKRRTGKASKASTSRKVRQVRSLWRKAGNEDDICKGVKCKFKALISASGHVGPIVMHFYGFKDTELTEDFIKL